MGSGTNDGAASGRSGLASVGAAAARGGWATRRPGGGRQARAEGREGEQDGEKAAWLGRASGQSDGLADRGLRRGPAALLLVKRCGGVDRGRRLRRELVGQGEALVGGRDQALAGALGDEAGAVGGEQDRRPAVSAVARERREADRDADRRSASAQLRTRPPTSWTAARTRSATASAGRRVGAGQDQRELVAAVAEDVVAVAPGARRSPRRSRRASVARLVAERVVDALKSSRSSMIRLNGSRVAGRRARAVLERAVVQQPGQVVGLGADLDRAVDLGVLQGDRDLGREQLDELELLLREARARAPRRSRVRTPVAPVAAAQRDARSGCRPWCPSSRNG